jgi:hypothetical protein
VRYTSTTFTFIWVICNPEGDGGGGGAGLHLTLMKVRSLLTHDCCHEIISEVTIAFASSTILYEYVGHFHISYLKLRLKVAYIKKKAVQV